MDALPVFTATSEKNPPRSFFTLIDDSSIHAKIIAKMISDDFIKTYPIDIDVYNGVVYLKGTVETDSQKRMTADLTRGVIGVIRVENWLLVKDKNITDKTQNLLIREKIKMDLLKDPDIGHLPIEVETTMTQVIITGRVRSRPQKQKATSIAKKKAGFREVINRITY
ncbi:MAG: BON domain-containing protein [Desulfobacteraceae bacterium]|nr:BON domain-containing protein [Desulfobacteraceae bacterium]